VLKGAVLFLADLSRQIPGEVTFDFIAVSSYGKDSRTSGQVKLNKDIDSSIEGKTVSWWKTFWIRLDPALSPAHFAATQAQKSPCGRSIGQSGPPSD